LRQQFAGQFGGATAARAQLHTPFKRLGIDLTVRNAAMYVARAN
jgi:hypothetical protein